MSLMSIRDIAVSFGGVRALRGISLEVPEGIILGLIGPNGAGKTTLINVISGLIKPTSGSLSFDGHEHGPWPMERAVSYGIARTFQQTRVFMGLTVRENLRIAREAGHGLTAGQHIDVGLNLEVFYDRIAGELPYGVLRQLGFALALMAGPKVLLLDEPAVGLTAEEIATMGRAIRRANEGGLTIILVEHNVRFLMEIAQYVAVMDQGSMLFEGTPAQCQVNPQVINVYLGKGGGGDVEN